MATLYVTEYQGFGSGGAQCPAAPPLVRSNNVDASAAHSSAALNALTTLVRLEADAICSYVVGPASLAPATAADARLVAGQVEYVAVPPNSGYKVHVVNNT